MPLHRRWQIARSAGGLGGVSRLCRCQMAPWRATATSANHASSSTQGGKSDRDRPTSAGEEPATSAKEAASGGGTGASGSAANKKRKGKR